MLLFPCQLAGKLPRKESSLAVFLHLVHSLIGDTVTTLLNPPDTSQVYKYGEKEVCWGNQEKYKIK